MKLLFGGTLEEPNCYWAERMRLYEVGEANLGGARCKFAELLNRCYAL
jgi:hypothetical protein